MIFSSLPALSHLSPTPSFRDHLYVDPSSPVGILSLYSIAASCAPSLRKTQTAPSHRTYFTLKRGPNVSLQHHESQRELGGEEGRRGRGKDRATGGKDNQRPFPPFPVLLGVHVTLCESPQVLCLRKVPFLWCSLLLSGNENHDCFRNACELALLTSQNIA